MKIHIITDIDSEIVEQTRKLVEFLGHSLTDTPKDADIALAPRLTRILTHAELWAPKHGTLIFHPSLLPRHAGPDAIKWAFRHGEKYTGATWFWGDTKVDGGDICEQEVLEILPDELPGHFYRRAVIPSALKLLRFALKDIEQGHLRKRPQRSEARTYETSLRLS